MNNRIEIKKIDRPIKALVEIPGSKSYTNRALIMAALTKGPVTLFNPLYSEDTIAMLDCLRTLGIQIETWADRLLVHGDISNIQNKHYKLFVHDSGTTMRFLTALLGFVPGIKTIEGTARLNERPIKELIESLREIGAKIDFLEKEGQAPLQIFFTPLHANEIAIDASISSQFLSALLMISPLMQGINIRLKGRLISKSFIDLTVHLMRIWGVCVYKKKAEEFEIPKGQTYQKSHYAIEGDFSSAGYFFAVAALTQSTITLKNLNIDSIQPDRKFLAILEKMGNRISVNDNGITIFGNQIIPLSINMEDCPDQIQTLAVLAAFAQGTTTISGIRSLRVKETERVQALKSELAKMGIKTYDTHDTLTIWGGSPQAAAIDTYGDHRMAMAFAVAGTKLSGVKINHPEVVKKTFPEFWDKLNSL